MTTDSITTFMLQIAWAGMLAGVISGAVIGLFFHRDDWMGGYDSFRRRLTRLGHISFFGLGFINFFFAITHHIVGLEQQCARLAAWAFVIGAVTMPSVCFLTAWQKPWRRLFPIPVLAVATGIIATLAGSANSKP